MTIKRKHCLIKIVYNKFYSRLVIEFYFFNFYSFERLGGFLIQEN